VVDFGPPAPFLLAYEIGRIAFPPDHLVCDGWLERGLALLAAYKTENPRNASELRLAPIAWLAHLIRSVYGMKQHYDAPVEFQAKLDRYWLKRARGAEILFDHLHVIVDALE
jgi:hypothetical protein